MRDRSKRWDGTGRSNFRKSAATPCKPTEGSRRPRKAIAKRMEKASKVSKVVGKRGTEVHKRANRNGGQNWPCRNRRT